jgi:hypothetical protein
MPRSNKLTWPDGNRLSWLSKPLGVLISLFSIILAVQTLTPGHDWGGDFSAYLAQASSLLEGNVAAYRAANSQIIQNSVPGLGPRLYPWGYPLLLAPLLGLFGMNLLVFKLVNILFFVWFQWALWKLLRDRLHPAALIAVLAGMALHPEVIATLDDVLSDIPFLLVSTLALHSLERWEQSQRGNFWHDFHLGFLLFLAISIRSTGFLLAVVFFMFAAWKWMKHGEASPLSGRIAHLKVFYPLGFCIMFLLVLEILLPTRVDSYFSLVAGGSFLESVGANLRYYFTELFPAYFVAKPLGVFFLLVGAGGMISRRRTDTILVVYILLTLVLMLSWPYRQGYRFFLPVIPLFLAFIFQGVSWVHRRVDRRFAINVTYVLFSTAWLLFLGAVLLLSFQRAGQNLRAGRDIGGPFSASSERMFAFIRSETDPGSTIGFFKPRVLYLRTGRTGLTVHTCERFKGIDYYIFYRWAGEQDQILLDRESCPGLEFQAKLIYSSDGFQVYRFDNPEASGFDPERSGLFRVSMIKPSNPN